MSDFQDCTIGLKGVAPSLRAYSGFPGQRCSGIGGGIKPSGSYPNIEPQGCTDVVAPSSGLLDLASINR